MKAAVQLLNGRQIPISREMLNDIKTFMEKGPGTTEQKLETLSHMANKKLDFTPQQLKAVHEVLHNQSFGRVLQDLADMDLDTSVTRRTDNSRNNLDPMQQKLEQLLQKLDQTVTDSHKSQAIKELIRDLQQGGNPGRIAKCAN